MRSYHPRAPDCARMVERIMALAHAYGARDLEALEHDVEVAIRVEYLTLERRVSTAYERGRRSTRRGGEVSPPSE